MHLPVLSNERSDRFARRVSAAQRGPLVADAPTTLQLNLGKLCNQACKHCHVDAGPNRTEQMDEATALACLALIRRHRFRVVDLTGGAPELNAHFRMLAEGARASGAQVIVRHNLTVQFEAGQGDLPAFFASLGAEVVGSLPHYLAAAADRQRGRGVFDKSLEALKALNAVGYGRGAPERVLSLMHNPVGAFLPGSQSDLERDFRKALSERHGVTFDRLHVLTNMPVKRFREWLERTGQYEQYQQTLEDAFNPATVPALMCRSTVSVSWDGRLYDCDFNQMLGLESRAGTDTDGSAGRTMTVADFDPAVLTGRAIVMEDHCFGCTAGTGSSCGGALTE